MESAIAAYSSARAPTDAADRELLAASQRGDREAYSELFHRYGDLVVAYAAARLQDREAARDIAVEAFARIWETRARLRADGNWKAYLWTTVSRLCVDEMRARRRRPGALPLECDPADPAPPPEASYIAAERAAAIRAAVGALPEDLRVPFVMHFAGRHTVREVADALRLPATTVLGRIARALDRLRRRLASEEGV